MFFNVHKRIFNHQRDWSSAEQELRRWVYSGGKLLPGLVTRHEAEAA
ncbi:MULTISPECIES: glycoside hydrolase family protein [Vibrio]